MNKFSLDITLSTKHGAERYHLETESLEELLDVRRRLIGPQESIRRALTAELEVELEARAIAKEVR